MRDDFKRLGGWLLFYIVITAVGLLFSVGTLTNTINYPFGSSISNVAQITSAIVAIIIGVYKIYLIINKQKPSSIGLIKNLIIIEGVSRTIFSAIVTLNTHRFFAMMYAEIYTGFDDPVELKKNIIISTALFWVIVVAIWWLYFNRSKRVKVYFRHPDYVQLEETKQDSIVS